MCIVVRDTHSQLTKNKNQIMHQHSTDQRPNGLSNNTITVNHIQPINKGTSLTAGRVYTPFKVFTVHTCTTPSLPTCFLMTRASSHWAGLITSSQRSMTSPSVRFGARRCHFVNFLKFDRCSVDHLRPE